MICGCLCVVSSCCRNGIKSKQSKIFNSCRCSCDIHNHSTVFFVGLFCFNVSLLFLTISYSVDIIEMIAYDDKQVLMICSFILAPVRLSNIRIGICSDRRTSFPIQQLYRPDFFFSLSNFLSAKFNALPLFLGASIQK